MPFCGHYYEGAQAELYTNYQLECFVQSGPKNHLKLEWTSSYSRKWIGYFGVISPYLQEL